ncbi:MAG: helix-turn-helix domain-containing protein [Acidimicrobiales bacterium]
MVETPTRRLLRREERQASILHGAAAAFAGAGFAATSMEDVADACGITKLIVYRHFDSKEELYRAILQRVVDRQAEELLRGLAHPGQPGLGARTLLTVAREDPPAFTLLWRHAPREPQFAAYARELRAMSVGAVRDLMAIASDDSIFDTWTAEVVIGWLVEAVLTWLEVGEAARDDEMVTWATEGLRRMRAGWVEAAIPFSP